MTGTSASGAASRLSSSSGNAGMLSIPIFSPISTNVVAAITKVLLYFADPENAKMKYRSG
jgi:hypothetical protein